ncbi:hypothetical protein GCM10027444_02870 [Actinopolyspora lacussalsi]
MRLYGASEASEKHDRSPSVRFTKPSRRPEPAKGNRFADHETEPFVERASAGVGSDHVQERTLTPELDTFNR